MRPMIQLDPHVYETSENDAKRLHASPPAPENQSQKSVPISEAPHMHVFPLFLFLCIISVDGGGHSRTGNLVRAAKKARYYIVVLQQQKQVGSVAYFVQKE